MIRIPTVYHAPPSKPEQNTVGSGSADLSDARRDPFKRRGERDGGLREGLSRDPRQAGGEDRNGRSLDFSRRVQEAMDELGGQGRDREGEPQQGQERLLAVVQSEVPLFAPQSVLAAAASSEPAVAGSAGHILQDNVADLAVRIEQAYRSDLSTSAGQTLSLRVPLDGLVEGLRDVVVKVTPTGLDITLTHTFGGEPGDLVQAAQMLATHLQTRFAKRNVRVFEVFENEGATGQSARQASDSLSEISRLLGRQGS